jgi:hypothetical protein
MVPDFGWFLPWRPARLETHSALALVTWSLPVGLLTYWVFQSVMKTPMRELLPDNAYGRSVPHAPMADVRALRQWLVAAGGILVGAITHLVWDGFTHEGARGVRMFPAIDEWWFTVGGRPLDGPRILQDVSSLIGLLVVAWLLWRALRAPSPTPAGPRLLPPAQRFAWIIAYVLTAVAVGTADLLLVHSNEPYGLLGNGGPLARVAIVSLRGLAVSGVVVSVCLGLRLRRDR